MCPSNPYEKHKEVISKLLNLGNQKNSHALKKFAILHHTDQEELTNVAKSEKDYSLKSLAIEKLTDQQTLLEIAQDKNPDEVKAVAISKITDKRKLLHLRLSESSSLQPLIQHQYYSSTKDDTNHV